MSWWNVKLIFQREVRDQLRDRRTLFTIAVLPLVLYPLLGMSFLQITQFMREHPTRVRLIGTDSLPAEPRLVIEDRLAPTWCPESEARLLTLQVDPALPDSATIPELSKLAQRQIQAGLYDALVYFPPNFSTELERFRREVRRQHNQPDPVDDSAAPPPRSSESPDDAPAKTDATTATDAASKDATTTADPPAESDSKPTKQPSDSIVRVPEPLLFTSQASDKSRIAAQRIERVLSRWREAVVQQTLRQNNIPVIATEPFEVRDLDVSEARSRRAAVWSKVLPFVVLIWALTGAFYPAIDLCAGEKERGTLETLLCSPARRSEIVLGKLATVMLFSASTALLNVVSMTITATLFARQLEQGIGPGPRFGAPPLMALAWLVVALLPISALFSALSLAVASFARSSKEGQYYLMPLLLITLPLMILPLLPTAELNLGTSLIPVTGAMLLLRSLIEGQFAEAAIYLPPVVAVTAGCCVLAIRWAVDQFNNENVLFRESERWDFSTLFHHMLRDRRDTPSFGQALMCGIVLLLLRFFATMAAGAMPRSWEQFAYVTVLSQIALIAFPPAIMALLLTRNARKTLLLCRARWWTLPASVLLALTLHPAGIGVAKIIQHLYPISGQVQAEMVRFGVLIEQAPHILAVLAVMALTPAICEELAFRGFILSGLRHSGHPWGAILISSAMFGAVHSVMQQSLAAFFLGLVMGYLAIRTGSLLSTMLFHLTYNSLSLLLSIRGADWQNEFPVLRHVLTHEKGELGYPPLTIVLGLLVAGGLFFALHRLPVESTAEEKLQATSDGMA